MLVGADRELVQEACKRARQLAAICDVLQNDNAPLELELAAPAELGGVPSYHDPDTGPYIWELDP